MRLLNSFSLALKEFAPPLWDSFFFPLGYSLRCDITHPGYHHRSAKGVDKFMVIHGLHCKHTYRLKASILPKKKRKLPYMNKIGEVIKTARESLKISQEDLAARISRRTGDGLTRSALSQIESGKTKNPKPANLQAACDILELEMRSAIAGRLVWLNDQKDDSNIIPFLKDLPPPRIERFDNNVVPGPDIKGGLVPLISWVRAGDWCDVVDIYEPGMAEEWMLCLRHHGPRAYALRVVGDSMTAPYSNQKSYPAGIIIFVDPDREITNGARVVAKIPGDNSATFKVYAEDAGKRFLRPINPQYPTIEMTPDMKICGVVIGSWADE
jgi:SOS-response transcriptional repressor LexA